MTFADVPVVTLELGNSQNLSAIVEGMDVIFECNIKSNPWVYKVAWRHKVVNWILILILIHSCNNN